MYNIFDDEALKEDLIRKSNDIKLRAERENMTEDEAIQLEKEEGFKAIKGMINDEIEYNKSREQR